MIKVVFPYSNYPNTQLMEVAVTRGIETLLASLLIVEFWEHAGIAMPIIPVKLHSNPLLWQVSVEDKLV